MRNQHPADLAIEQVAPLFIAPRFGNLPPLALHTKRYITARDGVYLETLTSHFHACVKVANTEHVLPYGECKAFITLRHGILPVQLLELAQHKAKLALPNEWAGWIIFDVDTESFHLREGTPLSSSAGHIHYRIPDDHSQLIVDIHSHGKMDAFFSTTDQLDEIQSGGVHFSLVLGHCHLDTPTIAARFYIDGTYINLQTHHLPFDVDSAKWREVV